MAMTFSQHEIMDFSEGFGVFMPDISHQQERNEISGGEFHLIREKLKAPETGELIERPRLSTLLGKSVSQFPATLISGRAGTGKTCLVSTFARKMGNVSWYSVESTDIEWTVFSTYFSACLSKNASGTGQSANAKRGREATQESIARFLLNCFSASYANRNEGPSMIVFDDIHHIFDASWFDVFFNLLLYSLPPETHLMLLCRVKPPGPLWRLRSKQMLNVIDERVITFDAAETSELLSKFSLSETDLKEAQRTCFGRASSLLQFAKLRSSILPPA